MSRNPIAKAVRLIKPKVVPDKRKRHKDKTHIDELHEYAERQLQRNNRRGKSCE